MTETVRDVKSNGHCLEAALDYLRRGWSPLALCPPDHSGRIPERHAEECGDPGKVPLWPWKEYQTQRPTPPALCSYWVRNPGSNVGIALGPVSGLVRVDVDSERGQEVLHDLQEEYGPLPATLTFQSARGVGYLYALPPGEEVRTWVLKGPDGGDLLRVQGRGGQTVLPPSVHGSGVLYEWGAKHGPGEIEPAVLPEWLRKRSERREERREPAKPRQDGGESPERRYALAALRKECEVVAGSRGGRNDQLNRSAFALGKLVGAGVLSEPEVVGALTEAAVRTGLNAQEIAKTVVSGLEAGKKQPRDLSGLNGRSPRPQSDQAANGTAAHSRVVIPRPPSLSLDSAAFHGLAGEMVREIEPHSEADPVALLVQILVAFGNAIGRTAHFTVEEDNHYLNLFAVLVGATSKARKGTSWGRVEKVLALAEPEWAKGYVRSGLYTAEGLIWAVRDPIVKRECVREKGQPPRYEEVEADPGVEDKRLLAYEPEFASLLKHMDTQGNTVSAILRQLWDGREVVESLTKTPGKTTGAHVAIIGNVTDAELRRYLKATEQANGFGNRILWHWVARSKALPEGGRLAPNTRDALADHFGRALAFARRQQAIGFDPTGRQLWYEKYEALSEGRPGLAGAMLGRAESQVRRLATLYALLAHSPAVGAEHVAAAAALWQHSEDTVRYVFGNALGDADADELLVHLGAAPDGLTREEIRKNVFSGHRTSAQIVRALGVLLQSRLAHCVPERTEGRPVERWFAGPGPA